MSSVDRPVDVKVQFPGTQVIVQVAGSLFMHPGAELDIWLCNAMVSIPEGALHIACK